MKIIHNLTSDEKLKIIQDSQENSFSFDSLLLANFTKLTKKTKDVVDLCCGNAPIAMLINKKNPSAKIIGVEIQKYIFELAKESIKLNELENSIEMINDNLIGISKRIGKNRYHLITCNPPFFKKNENSNLNQKNSIAMARHEISVTIEDVIKESKLLLSNIGSLNIIFRAQRLQEMIEILSKYNFQISRLQFVHPQADRLANSVLVEAKKSHQNVHLHVVEPMIVYQKSGEYTPMAFKVINQ